jgi:hypothetical protein
MTKQDIDRKAIVLINSAVDKVVQARRMGVSMSNVLPNHEQTLAGIFDWRDQQKSRVTGFSATAAQKAVYSATVKQAQAQEKAALSSLKSNYSATVKQINAQMSVAKKAKDTATQAQLTSLLTQAKNAYTAGTATTKATESQAVTAAKAVENTVATATSLLTPTIGTTTTGATTALPAGTPGTVQVTNPSTGVAYTLPASPTNGQQISNPDGTTLQYNSSSGQWAYTTPAATVASVSNVGTMTLTNPNTGAVYNVPTSAVNGQMAYNADGSALQYNSTTGQWTMVTQPQGSQVIGSSVGSIAPATTPYNGQQYIGPDGSEYQYNNGQWQLMYSPSSAAAQSGGGSGYAPTFDQEDYGYQQPQYDDSGGYAPTFDQEDYGYQQPQYSYQQPQYQPAGGPAPIVNGQPVTGVQDQTQVVGDDGATYQYDGYTNQWFVIAGPSGASQQGALDVFSNTDWSGGYGKFSSVTSKLNRMSPIPRSSVGGFGQWAALATTLLTSLASVGSSVASAEIDKSIAGASASAAKAAAAPAQPQGGPASSVPAVRSTSTNYTPWLIGGGLAIGALIIIMSTKKKGKRR